MKQLTCEMCGSTDLLKQDGVFICQSCGTKYSVEEAKKMMIEGTVDVSGSTVKIDNIAKLENIRQLAQRAKDDNNVEDAEKYYDLLLQEEPNNWEAAFYVAYFKTIQTKIAYILSSVTTFENSLKSILSLVERKHTPDEQVDIMTEIYVKSMLLANIICETSKSNFVDIKRNTTDFNASYYNRAMSDYLSRNGAVSHMLVTLAEILDSKYIATKNELYKNMEISALKQACDYFFDFWNCLDPGHQNHLKLRADIEDLCDFPANRIRKYEPEYNTKLTKAPQPSSGGGCYVATAVYGSYDCPQVWTLRRFRDNTLAKTWYGRAFIHTYYAISPTLVKWFGETEWFKNMWQGKLDRMVAKLQADGVECTPYEDKVW